MKRRWVVVMLGLRGLAAGHRSELSRHRSQESAQVAALDDLARLRDGRGNIGSDYTIVVEHAGQQFLVDDTDGAPVTDPWAERGQPVRAKDPAPIDDLLSDAEQQDAEVDLDDEELAPALVRNEEADAAPDEPSPTPAAQTDASSAQVRRQIVREPETPSGPVPADLISRWEAKAAAYDEWESRQEAGAPSQDE